MQKKLLKTLLLAGLMLVLGAAPALAKAVQYQVTVASKVYQAASTSAKVLATLEKGDKVTVTAVRGKWAKVKSGAQVGYMAKSALKKAESSSPTASGASMKQIQARLSSKGYLETSGITGKAGASTAKAIRIFQMMNGLKVTGEVNGSTVKRLMSAAARRKAQVNSATWAKSGINTRLHDGKTATIIDLNTGARLSIRRVGGHNHLDVEPKTAADTAVLKKVYGGAWSWDSRPILLIAGGRFYAAAMNGMPHGDEISKTNHFDGQFCIHLKGSLTHGTCKLNPYHQSNVNKVIEYFR